MKHDFVPMTIEINIWVIEFRAMTTKVFLHVPRL